MLLRLVAVWCLLLPAFTLRAGAQAPLTTRLNTLQNPRGITWHQIDTPNFSVIYPDSLDAEARRAAGLLERHYQSLVNSLGKKPRRISVVLNNQSLTSNAYVGWAPRRTQWYAMPNTTVDAFGPVDWYTLLATHEGRHVVQEQSLRTGWVGLFSRVFGDYAMALLGGTLYFPSWFWEGDAVGMETALTESGRGRQPQFTSRMRAMRASGDSYNYYPAWQGSFRTYYPDWYELGYLLTSYVRRHHGDSAWRRVTRSASWNPLVPWALSMALKKETGKSLGDLHQAAVAEAESTWARQRANVREAVATTLSPARDDYHVYSLPQYAGDGSVIATYWDLDTPTQLVRLKDGKREVLVERVGLVGELQFHVRGNLVVWSEYEADPRYGERNFLVVKRLDLTTRRVTRLTDRSRYYGPTLSPDGAQIAVVEFTQSRKTRLVLLDAATGAVQKTFADDRGFLVTPAWTARGDGVMAVRVDATRGNSLVRVALDGSEREVIGWTQHAISRPAPSGDKVLYGSPRSGLDAVWSVDTLTGTQVLLASRGLGAYFPVLNSDGTRALIADLTGDGFDVAEVALEAQPSAVPHEVLLADSVVAQEHRLMAATPAPAPRSDSLVARRYAGPRTLLDFHSLIAAPTSDGVNQGIALESRNMLNTFALTAGVLFNTNEQTLSVEAGASYAGLPALLDAGVRLGSRGSTYTDTAGREVPYNWNERSLQLAARLPFTRIMGQRRQSLTLSVGASFTEISDQPVRFRFENNNGRFVPLSYAVSASHVRAAAFRDLFQTGASASLVYRHTPGSSDYTSHIAAARATAIAPGLFRNHALVLDAGHEEQRPTTYRFSSELVFPRGFSRRYHDRLTRAGVSYHLPLLNPDLAIGPLLYFRRIQGAAFADVARGSDRTGSATVDYRSVGGELTAHIAPLGTRTTMSVGVRVSQRLTGTKETVTQFIVQLPQ